MIWRLRATSLDLSQPRVMAILNITPDSFSDGGKYFSAKSAVERALELERGGADIIDIGGQSTRTGYTPISEHEEWGRLQPVLDALRGRLSIPISVDTFYPYVAQNAVEYGASVINDVTSFDSPELRRICAQSGMGIILMHSADVTRSEDFISDIKQFFACRVEQCIADGIEKDRICLDCGIGFGKTREQEVELLDRMGDCRVYELPILAAASRKRVIAYMMHGYSESGEPIAPQNRDDMTRTAHARAIASGAQIVRQHFI